MNNFITSITYPKCISFKDICNISLKCAEYAFLEENPTMETIYSFNLITEAFSV